MGVSKPSQIEKNKLCFEWIRLGYSLRTSSSVARSSFFTCLQIIGLGIVGPCEDEEDLQVLTLDEDAFLRVFSEFDNDLQNKYFNFAIANHTIALCRSLLEEVGGAKDDSQHYRDARYLPDENLCILSAVIDIKGGNYLGDYEPEIIHQKLIQSSRVAARRLTLREVRYLKRLCLKVAGEA